MLPMPADIKQLDDQLDAVKCDADVLAAGLTEELAGWRAEPSSWSVAQCFDHLATANRVYLRAMEPSAARAREQRRQQHRPAVPGVVGRWFVWSLEPPVTRRFTLKAPQSIQPQTAPTLSHALASFKASHDEVRTFLRAYADLDLAGVRFPNPFIRGLRFSLATALHVIPAHERRHLWQAWRVRHAAERAAGSF
jgi:hypothetical protein